MLLLQALLKRSQEMELLMQTLNIGLQERLIFLGETIGSDIHIIMPKRLGMGVLKPIKMVTLKFILMQKVNPT